MNTGEIVKELWILASWFPSSCCSLRSGQIGNSSLWVFKAAVLRSKGRWSDEWDIDPVVIKNDEWGKIDWSERQLDRPFSGNEANVRWKCGGEQVFRVDVITEFNVMNEWSPAGWRSMTFRYSVEVCCRGEVRCTCVLYECWDPRCASKSLLPRNRHGSASSGFNPSRFVIRRARKIRSPLRCDSRIGIDLL